MNPIYLEAAHFSSGLAAVKVSSGGFDPEDWRDWDGTEEYPHRTESLAKFFKSHLVIGMSRVEVHALLGKGEMNSYPNDERTIESYALTTSWCGHGCSSFELLYEDDHVAGWRRSGIDEPPLFQRTREDLKNG